MGGKGEWETPEEDDVDLKDVNVERSNGVSLRSCSALFATRRIDTRIPGRTVQLRSFDGLELQTDGSETCFARGKAETNGSRKFLKHRTRHRCLLRWHNRYRRIVDKQSDYTKISISRSR